MEFHHGNALRGHTKGITTERSGNTSNFRGTDEEWNDEEFPRKLLVFPNDEKWNDEEGEGEYFFNDEECNDEELKKYSPSPDEEWNDEECRRTVVVTW